MKFTIVGVEYRIAFAYDWEEVDYDPLLAPTERGRQMTRALIFRLPYATGDLPFCQGTVFRYFKDPVSKEEARRQALRKAIKEQPGEFKAAAFACYLARHPEPAEALAQRFHEVYERLAPEFGYKTREVSAKPWKDVPQQNKHLMIAVCKELLGKRKHLSGRKARA